MLVLLGIVLIVSCVEEFKVPNTVSEKYESELVIQGRILSGEKSTFYLSMTSAFGDNGSSAPIEDATITIIGQNGYESKLAEYDRIHKRDSCNGIRQTRFNKRFVR